MNKQQHELEVAAAIDAHVAECAADEAARADRRAAAYTRRAASTRPERQLVAAV